MLSEISSHSPQTTSVGWGFPDLLPGIIARSLDNGIEKQVSLYENSIYFAMGGLLDPQNRWVKLSGMISWDQIEEKYSLTFDNPIKGSPAKSCRMAIGSLIIKEMCRFSDEDTVAMITENPYLQFFIGLFATLTL